MIYFLSKHLERHQILRRKDKSVQISPTSQHLQKQQSNFKGFQLHNLMMIKCTNSPQKPIEILPFVENSDKFASPSSTGSFAKYDGEYFSARK